MFDPLDLYTAMEGIADISENQADSLMNSSHGNDLYDEEELAIDCFDLPLVHYAPAAAILCILLLLKPTDQVNFQNMKSGDLNFQQICYQKGISMELINATEKYYQECGNRRLDSPAKFCYQIPTLATMGEAILKYYTLILKYYEMNPCDLKDPIIKEVSMRISENCGRTALPSVLRTFSVEGLSKNVEIYEPSLTADNLGWKTWGSSFILSQKLIRLIPHFPPTISQRVLELGAGTGLAGIAFFMKWIEVHGKNSDIEMFFTDLKEIVPNLENNVAINGLTKSCVVDTLDWTRPADFTYKHSDRKFNTIIVSDPIYSPNHPKLIVNMIKLFLGPDGVCHLQIPLRDKYSKERNELRTLLEKNNLLIKSQENDRGLDDWGKVDYLYQMIQWEK